jgi:hypothetical protein
MRKTRVRGRDTRSPSAVRLEKLMPYAYAYRTLVCTEAQRPGDCAPPGRTGQWNRYAVASAHHGEKTKSTLHYEFLPTHQANPRQTCPCPCPCRSRTYKHSSRTIVDVHLFTSHKHAPATTAVRSVLQMNMSGDTHILQLDGHAQGVSPGFLQPLEQLQASFLRIALQGCVSSRLRVGM